MMRSPAVSKSGQSLVEVVVALGVVVALAMSLITASLVTQRTSQQAKNNTQATNLVQQNIEQMRVFRDRRGFDVLANGACWTLTSSDPDPANWSLSSSCPESITLSNTVFSRSIVIANGANSNQRVVTVTVTWTDSGGLQTIQNTTVLSNCLSPGTPC